MPASRMIRSAHELTEHSVAVVDVMADRDLTCIDALGVIGHVAARLIASMFPREDWDERAGDLGAVIQRALRRVPHDA